MKKVLNYLTGNSNALRLNGDSVALSRAHNYDEPLIIYDQYGWRDGGRPRDVRIIFPPFESYTVVEKGDVYAVGSYTIVSSNTVGIINHLVNNPTVIDELSTYIKIKIIHSAIYDAGWRYHYEFDTKEDQYFNRKTDEKIVGMLNVIRAMNINDEFNRIQSRIKVMGD